MLEKITLKNFKAIQTASFKLTSPTVFIGNNGSGKSSVIEALQTLQNVLLYGISDAFTERWYGLEKIRNQQARGKEIEIELSGTITKNKFRYKITFNASENGDIYFIHSETLNYGAIKTQRIDKPFVLEDPARYGADDFAAYLRDWQFLTLIPELMYKPVRRNQASTVVKLYSSGENLADLFSRLQDDPTTFNAILDRMRYILPDLADITAQHDPLRKEVFLQLQENHHSTPLANWLFSTGTLRILAILTLLNSPKPPPILFIEEIENGLDPRTLNLLVEEIRNSLPTTQVIITTHSPYFLDLMDLSHVIVAERTHGKTTYFRPDSDQSLDAWKKEFSAGQLYLMDKLKKP